MPDERYGQWSGSPDWERYRAALIGAWQPFIDGTTTFDAAIDALVARLR